MSGIEVAGLLLGAIPILVEGLGTYKKGIKSVRTGFRKRKEVEKLCRALQQQERVLVELLKSILLRSGCDLPDELPAQIKQVLDDADILATVREYLGDNHDPFVNALQECEEIFQQLIYKITKLVPTIKGSSDLAKISDANRCAKSSQPDLVARLSLMLSKKDFEEECARLDASLNSMHRLLDLVSSNTQLAGVQTSGKSKRLARKLWTIRKQAEDLHAAVSQAWVTNCHLKHEAKLFLEDRVEQSSVSRKKQHDLPIQVFQFVFTGSLAQGQDFWHESMVQIFDDTQEPLSSALPPVTGTSRPGVTINAPPTTTSSRTQDIMDICSAIEKGKADQRHIAFTLTRDCKIGMDGGCKHRFTTFQAKDAVRLKDLLLSASQGPGRQLKSAWDVKILLALNVASSFLQLLRTPWIAHGLSTDTVTLLQPPNGDAEIDKPLLSVSFEASPNNQAARTAKFELKEALVELGIMLLEIWHGKTFEERFRIGPQPLRPFERQGHALGWLGSILETLPPSYHKAVAHCLAGAMTASPPPNGWDDMRLWENMCGNVIEPLAKLVRT